MSKESNEQNQILTFSVLIIAFIATAFAFYYAKTVLIPFVLALLLKTLITPMIDFQINKLKLLRLKCMLCAYTFFWFTSDDKPAKYTLINVHFGEED